MKKTKYQIFLIMIIMTIGLASVCIEQVSAASVVQVSSHTANVGDTVTVTVSMPDGTSSYGGDITWNASKLEHVSNSCNGGTEAGKAYVADGDTSGGLVKNLTITFKVLAEGEIVVSAKLRCLNGAGEVIHNDTNHGSIKVGTAPKEPNFTAVNETVYTKEACNIRESYSTDSKKIAKLEKGKSIKRVGVGDNGWSRVEYDGKTAYMSSQYLTTEKPPDPKFKDVEKTMYTAQECNIRKSFTTDSDKVGYLQFADEVKVTAEGDNGWSRIEYKGEVAYIKSSLLLNEKPEPPENNTVENNTVDDTNIVNEDSVENNLLGELQNEIGVIPEVGNNFSEYAYMIITTIVLISILYMSYKSRNEENK